MFTAIYTYESVKSFVENRLNMAKQSTYAMVDIFEAQAFGAVELVCGDCYKVQPELSNRLSKKWEEEWREMFWDIRCEKLRD